MSRLKVVAHRKSGQVIKGFADLQLRVNEDGSLDGDQNSFPKSLTIHSHAGGRNTTVQIDTLKAIYFVKTFEGDAAYAETKFFNPTPEIGGLWVHVTFLDGESTQGIVRNNMTFITEPGFLMKPPDPHSNNNAVYVLKSALSQFRVVGVRAEY